jgi:hypothetical protein
MARKDFNEEDSIKVLLWCGRHCCLCEKPTAVGIEVAHLPGRESSSDIDDAIPLCFDCHAAIGHYNKSHPKGKQYAIRELKARRDQVYNKFTSHLVPPVDYKLTQRVPDRAECRHLPDVGFQIHNLGDTYWVQVRVKITLACGASCQTVPSNHYNGSYLWNLNPRHLVFGHFEVPENIANQKDRLRARVDVTIVDVYGRQHQLLPMGWVHAGGPNDDWYAEPSMEELGIVLSD